MDFRQAARNAVQSALPRSVHVAEVVSEALVSELSAPASHRLDAATEDHHSCVDVRNQPYPDLLTSSLLRHTRKPHARVSPAPTSKSSLPTLIPRSISGLCLLMVNTSQSTSQHCSFWLHSCMLSATFTTSSSFAFLASHSLWPCLECAVSRCASGTLPDRLLLDHLVLLSFTRSLVLSVASCNVTSFTARAREDLPSVSIFNEGHNFAVHVSSTMAGLMLSRHHSLFLESLLAGCARGYASCVHRESSVSPQHALPRAAGGLLVLKRGSHSLRALRVQSVVSRPRLLWSLPCKTTS